MRFWYQHYVKGDNFQQSLLPVATIATVQQFWQYYQFFKRPNQLDQGSYIYLFQESIKPVWEDPSNSKGGAFILMFKKDKCNQLWQNILLAFITAKSTILSNLNGIRIKIRMDHCAEIDFWVKNTNDFQQLEKSRSWILQAASLSNLCPIELIYFNKQ